MKIVNAKFAKDKQALVSELGARYNLSFSSHFILGNKLIALDGIKKCLLVAEAIDALNKEWIIELSGLTSVSVKKSYGSIGPGELQKKKFEDFLQRIDLQFEYANDRGTIVLSFYNAATDRLQDIPGLERNARNWQMILSRMAGLQKDKTLKDRNLLASA